MKRLLKLIGVLLAMVLSLSACTVSDADPTSENASSSPLAEDSLQMYDESGNFRYALIRSQDAEQEVVDRCVTFLADLRAVYGEGVRINDDFVERSVTEEELTDRKSVV